MREFYIPCIMLAFAFFGFAVESKAQTLTEIQNLSFGTFALSNNNAIHSITVDVNNNVTADPEIVVNIPPERGEYLLEAQDPNRALDIIITDGSLTLGGGGGKSMTVSTFTDNSPSTDGAGDATIYIGATLTTDGNTALYNSGSYEDNTVQMTINYQ